MEQMIFPEESISGRQHPNARANWTRLGLIAALAISAAAAFLAWDWKADIIDGHRTARQLVLHFTLRRIDDPVIVLGDSIVEASTLPRSICGHAIVNAGLSGASTASDLGIWLSQALERKQAALIVVSLGTNDALSSASANKQSFEDRYGILLVQLSKLTPHLAILEIPPIEAQGRMTVEMQNEAMTNINSYNTSLPAIAKRSGATFVALPVMTRPFTIDGVHLSSGGYQAWDKAVLQAAERICS
jgi:lysophospholipase L1-like esterase